MFFIYQFGIHITHQSAFVLIHPQFLNLMDAPAIFILVFQQNKLLSQWLWSDYESWNFTKKQAVWQHGCMLHLAEHPTGLLKFKKDSRYIFSDIFFCLVNNTGANCQIIEQTPTSCKEELTPILQTKNSLSYSCAKRKIQLRFGVLIV